MGGGKGGEGGGDEWMEGEGERMSGWRGGGGGWKEKIDDGWMRGKGGKRKWMMGR